MTRRRLKDTGEEYRLVKHTVDLKVHKDNTKTLDNESFDHHLRLLSPMLQIAARFVDHNLPQNHGGENNDLEQYLYTLAETVDLLGMKNWIAKASKQSDIARLGMIDPTDSGFPLFIRDFKYLKTDQDEANKRLQELPSEDQLTETALTQIFRGKHPDKQIHQQLQRNYFNTLEEMKFPKKLDYQSPIKVSNGDESMHLHRLSVGRLDDGDNVPRLYTFMIQVPDQTYKKGAWHGPLEAAVRQGLSSIADLELPYLAKTVEEVEGIQLNNVQRMDIGPFFTKYTNNDPTIDALLSEENDSILMLQQQMVFRQGERKRKGIGAWLKGKLSGDTSIGSFAPAIQSPQYALMPHEMIQIIHQDPNIKVDNDLRMYGITNQGDIVD